jgi:hypothetical protein
MKLDYGVNIRTSRGMLSSGKWHLVTWQKLTKMSKESTTFIDDKRLHITCHQAQKTMIFKVTSVGNSNLRSISSIVTKGNFANK